MSRIPTRPGYRAVSVDFRGDRPRVLQWEKIEPDPPADHLPDAQKKVRARGALAAERRQQGDLFGRD